MALHAFDLGHVRPGAGAGVFGCGPLGLLLVQLLRMAGASPIVATDPLAHRVAAAEELGATHAVLAGELALDAGLEVAFEAAGDDGAVDEASPRSARADASSSSASPTTTAPPFARRLQGARA